ncbi:MAG: 1,4-alpha-glucan branching protein GlgB [Clostridia bacterium]|nr:1,4-alpha-glucan branching protein GlgB [Clostridia bacterium]MBR2907018.1 1,4-alpha-glucan branching protein GlgB [Clostridia bacterium]
MNPKISFSPLDLYLFHEGTHRSLYQKMGAHITAESGIPGTHFRLWAPNARAAALLSARGNWQSSAHPMERRDGGIWECFVPEMGEGELYRYAITGADGICRYKSDPFAFHSELRPRSASIVSSLGGYVWSDHAWMHQRERSDPREKPIAVYEVHLGSWKKDYGYSPETGFLNYRTLAHQLADYVSYMGYTHVELIGISEHPLDASWGYQVTGYYSPTSRYGTPDDFRYFVDHMHRSGIGVILDWVPAHFPKDAFGLSDFDGTCLYEHTDPLRREYPEWGTRAFDLGKSEVVSFLTSNAFYWIREFHVDALRVDAVAAILFSSFGRYEWRPNRYGGPEDLEGIAFLQRLNRALSEETSAYLIAEDSSIMSGITKRVEDGGIGFKFKWNMGWMNDTLRYVKEDPLYRGYHHDKITHSIDYAFLESFMLVLSHDEVVHLKRSMLEKIPGRIEDKFGGLKTLYTYQMTHPGKKLLFMGQDFAETAEWMEDREINWSLTYHSGHRDVMNCMRRLLTLYKKHPVLYVDAGDPATFEWVNRSDAMRATVSYMRRNPWNYNDALLVICNFAPMDHGTYTCGVPSPGSYRRIFSTIDVGDVPPASQPIYHAENRPCDGYPYALTLHLHPYESVVFAFQAEE